MESLCACHHLLVCLFVCLFLDFDLFSFVSVRFDTCPVHGTATLLGPKFAFISGYIDTTFLSLLAIFLLPFPLFIVFAHSGMLIHLS